MLVSTPAIKSKGLCGLFCSHQNSSIFVIYIWGDPEAFEGVHYCVQEGHLKGTVNITTGDKPICPLEKV